MDLILLAEIMVGGLLDLESRFHSSEFPRRLPWRCSSIQLIDQLFAGHYQADAYWYESERDGQIVREPVTLSEFGR